MNSGRTRSILPTSILTIMLLLACNEISAQQSPANEKTNSKTNASLNKDSIVYETKSLVIRRLSTHVYEHKSFLKTKDFGNVDCNGMIVIDKNEAIVFDTPADDESSEELIKYLDKLRCRIKAVIPTHFHEDCVGGLKTFEKYNIPAYASNQTIELLEKKRNKFFKTLKGFDDSLALDVGDQEVYAVYYGEGHTKDNIVGYMPNDNAVFGGCLVKEAGATKGNLEDANVAAWPATVRKLKEKYPQVQIVIPGHGKWGRAELFDYTIKLFE